MSFLTKALTLDGSSINSRPLKPCTKCGEHRESSGGVELGPGRWVCLNCWINKSKPGNRAGRKI